MKSQKKSVRLVKCVVASCTCLLSFAAGAADYTFPTKNGDLASPADWGGTSIPGSSDVVIIDQAGTGYTVSEDVTFGNIKFATAAGTTKVTATGVTVKVNPSDGRRPLNMDSTATEKRYHYLIGGTWDVGGKDWEGLYKNCWLYLQDGAVMTNMAALYVSKLPYAGARVIMTGQSRIHCSEINVVNTGTDGRLIVQDGSKVISSGTFYVDRGGSGTRATQTTVSGAESEISCSNVHLGYKGSSNVLNIWDGGLFNASESIRLSAPGSDYKNNFITMTNGTLRVGKWLTLNSTASKSGYGIFAKDSTIEIGGGLTNNACGSTLDFQNVALTVGGDVVLFSSDMTKSTVRFGGKDGTMPKAMRGLVDYFPLVRSGVGNKTFIADDGFKLTHSIGDLFLVRAMSNSLVRVSGGASLESAGTVGFGHNNYNTGISNRIEIVDGGSISASDIRLMGIGNTLVISNGTLTAAGNGIMLGYNYSGQTYSTSDSRVILQGASPLLDCGEQGTFWMKNGNALRFEIPAAGYASGFCPVVAKGVTFDANATLEIDYADYLAAGGGELVLMSFLMDMSEKKSGNVTFPQWVKNQETAMNLPKGCKLRAVTDANGTKVVFRAGDPLGLSIIVR